jgi:hypothetical protein
MLTVFYIAPTRFGAIIKPSSGSRHRNLFKGTEIKQVTINIHMLCANSEQMYKN